MELQPFLSFTYSAIKQWWNLQFRWITHEITGTLHSLTEWLPFNLSHTGSNPSIPCLSFNFSVFTSCSCNPWNNVPRICFYAASIRDGCSARCSCMHPLLLAKTNPLHSERNKGKNGKESREHAKEETGTYTHVDKSRPKFPMPGKQKWKIPNGGFPPTPSTGRGGGCVCRSPSRSRQSGSTYVMLCNAERATAVDSEGWKDSNKQIANLTSLYWSDSLLMAIYTILTPSTSHVAIIQCYYKTSRFTCRNISYAGVLCGDILTKIGMRGRLNR